MSASDTMRSEEEGGARRKVRVACIIEDDATRLGVERLLQLWLPGVELEPGAASAVRDLPEADALVLGAPRAGEAALEPLRRVRARGFRGAVVVVVPGDATPAVPAAAPADVGMVEEERSEWVRLAGAPCRLGAGAGERLASTLVEALPAEAPLQEELEEELETELWETRRRLAVATVAMRLQHALNNPLAALLAEAQLLELEPLLPEHHAALRRMVELCRRMSDTVRSLDGAGGETLPRRSGTPPASGRGDGGWFGRGGG